MIKHKNFSKHYLKKVEIHKSSLLFVNNRDHARHKRTDVPIKIVKDVNKKKEIVDDKLVFLKDIFNDKNEKIH